RTAPRTRCRSRRRWWPRLRVPETTGSRQICRQACVHSVLAALLLGVVLQDAGDRKRSAGTLLVRDRDVGGDARIGGVVLASRVGDQALQFGAAALVAERKEAQEDDWQHVALVVRGLDGAPQVDRGLPELRGSEPDYLRPGDLRVSFAQFRRSASACLAKQRQTAQYRALNDSVVEEGFPPPNGKTGNQFDLFDGIEKAETVRPHSKIASRITSDARRGLSPRAETTSTLQSSTVSRSSNKPVRSRSDRPGSKSTRKSISESCCLSPRATEPNTRMLS